MKNNYLIAINEGWEELLRKDPQQVAEYMNVTYVKNDNLFFVPHLNENYIVDCDNKIIKCERDGSNPGIELTMLILHYLTFFKEKQNLEHKWVSLKEIPNGGILFYPAFYHDTIEGLIKTFGNDRKLFLSCAKELGGLPGVFGEASALFNVFPKIPIYVVIWEGDGEIKANATVLFDKSIQHFLHIESIIGVGGYIAKRLILLARKKCNKC